MPTPFGRSHCPLQSGYFDSSCAAALVITVANARKNAMAPVGLLRGSMATSKEHASKRKNTTHPRQGERAPQGGAIRADTTTSAFPLTRCNREGRPTAGLFSL